MRLARKKMLINVPIRGDQILEITPSLIKVYNDEETVWSVPIKTVRSIVPIKDTGIRIYYKKDDSDPTRCETEMFNLGTDEIKSAKLCSKIFDELVSQKIISKNKDGLLYLRPNEHIVSTCPNVSIDKEKGLLYVTNKGIVHETAKGISTDVSFEHVMFIRDRKNGITIGWDNTLPILSDPVFSFDLVLPKIADRDSISLSIREQFTNFDYKKKYSFSEINEYYSKLSHNELYGLARSMDEDFVDYLKDHTKFTFGKFSPYFSDVEFNLIMACKLNDWDINLITSITDAEERQRAFSQRHTRLARFIEKGLGKYKKDLEALAKFDDNSDKVRSRLEQDENFLDLKEKLDYIRDNNSELVLVAACTNKNRAESIRYYDKRVELLYKLWCKDEPLQNFTDEYDDEWIEYMIDRLDTPEGHYPVDVKCVDYEQLSGLLSNRDNTREVLEDFSNPDNTNKKDIYNNCWYDKQHNVWYLDDTISETLQDEADFDPDQSEEMIGRSVWGFKKNKVKMFCGFPSVRCKSEGGEVFAEFLLSRNTGQILRQRFSEYINYILPILRDEDINSAMEIKFGEMIYQSTEIQNTIHPSGSMTAYTPRMLKFACKRYGMKDLPINERVRRALFSIDTSLFLNPEADTYLDTNEDPRSYPDIINDERFD